jgi:hypothetical protein
MTPDQFLHRCPALWHVAPAGAWENIAESGLRTAEQLLAAADLEEEERVALAETVRAEPVELKVDGHVVMLRDQAPLLRGDLVQHLEEGLEIGDWVRTLNRRTYLFADQAKMRTLLDKYIERDGAQDVLTLSPRRLLDVAQSSIELSAQNSGAVPRKTDPSKGRDTFVSITRFANKKPAEVTLVGGLTDLLPVVRVERHTAEGRTPLR